MRHWGCLSFFLSSVGVVEILPRRRAKMPSSLSLFLQELELLSQVPVTGFGGSKGKLGAGRDIREDWRKYGWESQEEYLNSQWHVKRDAIYAEKFGTATGRRSDYLAANSFDYMALSESYLGNYYANVSTFFFYSLKESRTIAHKLQHVIC